MNNKAFDALRNEHRRELLLALLEHNPQTFTKPIPAGGQIAPLAATQQFQSAMYHLHLPKLEEYGFIRWEKDAHEIVKGPQFEELRPLLECIQDGYPDSPSADWTSMEGGIEGVDDLLVVEDNPGDARFIEEAFGESELGPTIHIAGTVEEALDYLHRRGDHVTAPRPDVILLDWHLIQNTSKEVLDASKSIDSSIPVVVMTGSTAEVEKLAGSIPQADVCIEKQTDPEAYIEVLRSLLTEP